jgi:hypothetical protein
MESHERYRGIWETETALILEVMKTEDNMKNSYRRWAANATYSLFLHMLHVWPKVI